jgi:hypothetical protein
MKYALLVLAACSSKTEPAGTDPPKTARIDARPRPDAGPPPDATVRYDAGPRPYVERVPCPYDRMELESAARAAWGPPPDAGVEVQCVTAAAPMAAWVLWGHAGLDNRFEIHRTIVKASPGHSVLGDDYHRTTDRDEVSPERIRDSVEAHDLDDDGTDELVLIHSVMRSRYADPTSMTLSVYALRNGALVESATRLPVAGPGCWGNYSVRGSPGAFIEITGREDSSDPACPPKGRRRYVWDPDGLTLTEK